MYRIRVESEFAAAHFLSHYHGKCERLHGHNYLVRLWARSDLLNEGGMVADFALLKDALRKVCKTLDHTHLNDHDFFAGDPSSERIAFYIYHEVVKILPPEIAEFVNAVDVFETPGSMARYEKA